MSILYIFLVLIIFGVLLWLVNSFIPMQPQVKTIINVLAVLILVFWLISIFFPGLGSVRVPAPTK